MFHHHLSEMFQQDYSSWEVRKTMT